MKKLIPALCLLLVSAMLLGTSTFAWFSMNSQVSANGMSVTATTPLNLLINNVDNASTYANQTSLKAASAAVNGKMLPASSSTATVFNAVVDGSYIGANGEGGVADGTDNKNPAFQATGTLTQVNATNGYWLNYTVYLKLSEAQDADANVYLSNLTVATYTLAHTGTPGDTTPIDASWYVSVADSYVKATGTTAVEGTLYYTKNADGLNKAARVGIIVDGALKGIYAITGATAEYTAIAGTVVADTRYNALGAANKVVVKPVLANAEGIIAKTAKANIGAADVTNTFAVNATAVAVTVVVWVEGQDAACVNANSGATLNVGLSFSIAD